MSYFLICSGSIAANVIKTKVKYSNQWNSPDGSVTTHFVTTPLMSTYLVAFHVSDFSSVSVTPPRSIPQRMFTRSTAINATALPLEAGELLVEALTDYIGIEYSLPKMDHVAIPRFVIHSCS